MRRPLSPPKVAILMETSRSFGRGVIRGIARYGRVHGPWLLHIEPAEMDDVEMPPANVFAADAVVGRIQSRQTAAHLAALKLPVVCMGGEVWPGPRLVGTSQESICQAAFDYFRQIGFRRFAFAGGGLRWGNVRAGLFKRVVEAAGASADIFLTARPLTPATHALEQADLAAWLVSLKKPVGVLAADDFYGRYVIDACRLGGLHVPEEVAVVGIDNDELPCEAAVPSLSSVALNAERIGYEAAALLNRMFKGEKPRDWVEIPPLGVVPRQSSDLLAIEDPDVALAVRLIREGATKGITIEQISRQVSCSERSLLDKFRKLLGRTPHAEVHRVQIERAKTLLVETEMKLEQIATNCGLANAQYLHALFRKNVGMTPGTFRRSNRRAGR